MIVMYCMIWKPKYPPTPEDSLLSHSVYEVAHVPLIVPQSHTSKIYAHSKYCIVWPSIRLEKMSKFSLFLIWERTLILYIIYHYVSAKITSSKDLKKYFTKDLIMWMVESHKKFFNTSITSHLGIRINFSN